MLPSSSGGQSTGAGTGEASFLADTWEWDGTQWKQRSPAVPPGARYFSAAAYDPGRRAVVLFGGSDRGHSTFDQTWEWDGTSWTEFPAAGSPSPRADAPMVFDAARGACLLFGGDDGSLPADTWERRGTTWSQRSSDVSPPGRRGSLMAFDQDRGVAVLFGGSTGPPTGPRLADTWEWDGTTRAQRGPVASPPARSAGAMAYDSARSVVTVFGGNGDAGPLGDTWEWNGTAWARL